MRFTRFSLRRSAIVCALAVGGAVATPALASATPISSFVCAGSPLSALPSGTYSSVTVSSGACFAAAGDVHVLGDLTVADGAALVAAFGNSNLTVDGDVIVAAGGALIMGCEPDAFPCLDDATAATNDIIRGSLIANGALASVVHHTTINAGIRQNGGGGGATGFIPIPALLPTPAGFVPAYSDYEDNAVSGGLRVTNLQTGWFGVFRNHVNGTVVLNNNVLFDPDANEVADNIIHGSLKCSGNDPAIQIGDSGGGPNTVTGQSTGQCANPVIS